MDANCVGLEKPYHLKQKGKKTTKESLLAVEKSGFYLAESRHMEWNTWREADSLYPCNSPEDGRFQVTTQEATLPRFQFRARHDFAYIIL